MDTFGTGIFSQLLTETNNTEAIEHILSSNNQGTLTEIARYEDIWGVDIAVRGLHFFVSNADGFIVYDISDIGNPVQVGKLETDPGKFDIFGDMVFLANGDLKIISIEDVTSPYEITSIGGDQITDVEIQGNYLYYIQLSGSIWVYDISDFAQPKRIGYYFGDLNYPNHLLVRDDHLYLASYREPINIGGSETSGFYTFDISDPSNPLLLQEDHISRRVKDVAVVGNQLYLGLSTFGIYKADISSPENPKINTRSDQHMVLSADAFDNFYAFHDYFVYTEDHRPNPPSRLILWDINDAGTPTEVGSYDLPHTGVWDPADVEIVPPYIFVASGKNGIYVLSMNQMDPCYGSFQNLTGADTKVYLDDLINKKKCIISKLEGKESSSGITFPSFDEKEARELVKYFENNKNQLSDEKVEAFARLTLQEETLSDVYDNYVQLGEIYSDAEVDLVRMSKSALLIFKTKNKILFDLVQKTLKDIVVLWVSDVPDEAYRNSALTYIENIDTIISSIDETGIDIEGLLEELVFLEIDEAVKYLSLRENIDFYVNSVQPSLNQSVWQVMNFDSNSPTRLGDSNLAYFRMEEIQTTSRVETETMLYYYDRFAFGRQVNEVIKDVTDTVSISSGLPYSVLASFWTRVEQIIIDQYSKNEIAKTMVCLRELSILAGELAFNPEPGTISCDEILNQIEHYPNNQFYSRNRSSNNNPQLLILDQTSWRDLRKVLQDDFESYKEKLISLKGAIADGEEDDIRTAIQKLEKAQKEINYSTGILVEQIQPVGDNLFSPENREIMEGIVYFELNAMEVFIGANWLLEDYPSIGAEIYVNQAIDKLEITIDDTLSEINTEYQDTVEDKEDLVQKIPNSNVLALSVGFIICIMVLVIISGGLILFFMIRKSRKKI